MIDVGRNGSHAGNLACLKGRILMSTLSAQDSAAVSALTKGCHQPLAWDLAQAS